MEAFGFALRAQRIAGQVQPFQRGVLRRVNIVDNGKSELCRQLFDDQLVILLTVGAPRLAVHLNAHQRQIFAIQHQRCAGRPLTFDFADGGHARGFRVQTEVQIDIGRGVIGRAIIVAVFCLWLLCHKNP